MTRTLVAALVVTVLSPRLAAACATCISSAYGDRTYNWAYIGLLLMPFAVALVIGGVFVWSAGYRLDLTRLRRAISLRKATLKETT
jgi:fructose-1,6-bisphosphatase